MEEQYYLIKKEVFDKFTSFINYDRDFKITIDATLVDLSDSAIEIEFNKFFKTFNFNNGIKTEEILKKVKKDFYKAALKNLKNKLNGNN